MFDSPFTSSESKVDHKRSLFQYKVPLCEPYLAGWTNICWEFTTE